MRTPDAQDLASVHAGLHRRARGYDRDFAEQLIAFVGDGVSGESCFDRPGGAAGRGRALNSALRQRSVPNLQRFPQNSVIFRIIEALFLHGFDGTAVARSKLR